MRVHNLSDAQIRILLKVRARERTTAEGRKPEMTDTREIALPALQSNPAC